MELDELKISQSEYYINSIARLGNEPNAKNEYGLKRMTARELKEYLMRPSLLFYEKFNNLVNILSGLDENDEITEDSILGLIHTGIPSIPTLYDLVVAIRDADGDLLDYISAGDGQTLRELIDSKQETLVSGTNIKTINNQSLLGSGNINISGGGGGGTTDYNDLTNKPAIDSVELSAATTLSDIGAEASANKDDSIPTTPDAGHYPTTAAVKDYVDGKHTDIVFYSNNSGVSVSSTFTPANTLAYNKFGRYYVTIDMDNYGSGTMPTHPMTIFVNPDNSDMGYFSGYGIFYDPSYTVMVWVGLKKESADYKFFALVVFSDVDFGINDFTYVINTAKAIATGQATLKSFGMLT